MCIGLATFHPPKSSITPPRQSRPSPPPHAHPRQSPPPAQRAPPQTLSHSQTPVPRSSRSQPARSLAQRIRDRLCNLARVLLRSLRRGHRPIALKVRQVRPVRPTHRAQLGIKPQRRKTLRQPPRTIGGQDPSCRQPQSSFARRMCRPAYSPTCIRKRLPARLNASCSGVSSNPTSTSKLVPENRRGVARAE